MKICVVNVYHILVAFLISVTIIFLSVMLANRLSDKAQSGSTMMHQASSYSYDNTEKIHKYDLTRPDICEQCHMGSGPTTDSSFCMGCHDGTIGYDISIGNSHPVSVLLNPSGDLKYPDNPNVRLFNNKVECLSCHLAHDKGNGMIDAPMAGSELCLECHRK